jgi:predicted nucleic acid-binding protein
MPILTEDEIKAHIANGNIFAISVDTNVFDNYGCNLDFPILKRLDQFKNGAIKVLFSEIVIKEVERHIVREAEETQRVLKKALKKQTHRWKREVDIEALPEELELKGNPEAVAEAQIAQYVELVAGEVVSAGGDGQISEELLRRYFAGESPFEAKEKKKHEFPDGFALLTLEAATRASERLIICVTSDGGWQKFAEHSEHVVCVPKLDVALSYFNDAGRHVADETIAIWQNGKAPDLESEIESAFEYRLDDNDFRPDGSSHLYFESEPLSAVLQSIDVQSASHPIVINADDEAVTFTTRVKALVLFEANFSFSVRDYVDKDYVSLGSEEFSVEETEEFQLVITVGRDLDPEPQVIEVEVVKQRFEVNFGEVEPFPGEDPTHEKY